MRLIEFAKWWWKRSDYFIRTVGCFTFFWVIPCAVSSVWLGAIALQAILIGLLATMVSFGLCVVLFSLKSVWDKFNKENPPEDVRIMNKLRGEAVHNNDRYD